MIAFLVGMSLLTLAVGSVVLCAVALTLRPDLAGAEKLTEAGSTKVLVVTAHPDDECLFFAPTIVTLCTELDLDVHLICLSTGDYDQLGSVRKGELVNSCLKLGMPVDRVKIVDDSDLPDDPRKHWSPEKIANVVGDYVAQFGIDTIITFDEGGISGHLNHIALHCGMEVLLLRQKQASASPSNRAAAPLTGYSLKTVPLLRKYLSFLEFPFCSSAMDLFKSLVQQGIPDRAAKAQSSPDKLLFVSGASGYMQAWAAMKQHKTQWVWFRKLYAVFSRYMIINELARFGT